MLIDINKYDEYFPQYNTRFLAASVNISNDSEWTQILQESWISPILQHSFWWYSEYRFPIIVFWIHFASPLLAQCHLDHMYHEHDNDNDGDDKDEYSEHWQRIHICDLIVFTWNYLHSWQPLGLLCHIYNCDCYTSFPHSRPHQWIYWHRGENQ